MIGYVILGTNNPHHTSACYDQALAEIGARL